MKSCAWTSARTREVGSTYVQVAQFLGRRIDTHFRVTELVPGRRISIESTQSTFPIQVTRKVEPLGDARCRVTAHIRGQPTGLFKVLAGSPFDFVQRSVRKDYDRLKAVLESESR